MVKRRPSEIIQVNLRMREDLRQRLSRQAEKESRSFNAELVHRLEQSFERDTAADLLAEAHKLLKEISDLEVIPRALDAAKEAVERFEKAEK